MSQKIWVLTVPTPDTVSVRELEVVQGTWVPSGRELRVTVTVTLDGETKTAGLNDLLFTAREELLKLSPGFKRCDGNPLREVGFIESWALPATPATEEDD